MGSFATPVQASHTQEAGSVHWPQAEHCGPAGEGARPATSSEELLRSPTASSPVAEQVFILPEFPFLATNL